MAPSRKSSEVPSDTYDSCALLLANGYLKAPELGDPKQTVDEVIVSMQRTGEGWYLPELYRVRGEALAAKSIFSEAREAYEKAMDVARSQEARYLELRAAMGLARLLAMEGKTQQARDLLGSVFGWFTEGFTTGDLMQARMLLDELRKAA